MTKHPGSEPSLAVVTPSYAPDFELCADLVASVKRFAAPDVRHHIIVPQADLERFGELSGARTHVHPVTDFLPRSFCSLPLVNGWVNLRRPFPPIRGWIAQQVVKLSAVAALDVDVALLVDSDMVMIRPFGGSDFVSDGRPALYHKPDAIGENLPRHRVWHDVSRRLLGLGPSPRELLPDYIGWPCPWEPELCRRLTSHIERVTGGPWQTAVASQLHFSEMILYGVFVDEVYDPQRRALGRVETMRAVTHDQETPLDPSAFRRVLAQISDSDLAVMVSAKSGTALEVRRQAWAEWASSEQGWPPVA